VAQLSYRQESNKQLYFYRTAKGSLIDLLVVENEKINLCIKVFDAEVVRSKQLDLLRSFQFKNQNLFHSKSRLIGLSGTLERIKDNGVEILSWESIV
jgi:hypothetical protein